eukprot:11806475-Karenia_brevis.AAC.1
MVENAIRFKFLIGDELFSQVEEVAKRLSVATIAAEMEAGPPNKKAKTQVESKKSDIEQSLPNVENLFA